jgi:hypothetical protein
MNKTNGGEDMLDQTAVDAMSQFMLLEAMSGEPDQSGVIEIAKPTPKPPARRLRSRERRDKDGNALGRHIEPGPGQRITSIYIDYAPPFSREPGGKVTYGKIAVITEPSRGRPSGTKLKSGPREVQKGK